MKIDVYLLNRDSFELNGLLEDADKLPEKRVVSMQLDPNSIIGFYIEKENDEITIFTTGDAFVSPYTEDLVIFLGQKAEIWEK